MALLRRIALRFVSFLRPGRGEEELARELAAHLALLEAEYQRCGMSDADARLAARRAIGGIEQTKESQRDARSFVWLEDARRDVRHAARWFMRHPLFSATVVLTFALGIGPTTAIFSIVQTVLLQPLPYRDPYQLVRIVENIPASETLRGSAVRTAAMNEREFVSWRTQSKTLSHMAASVSETVTLRTETETERVNGARVSPELFPMLGIEPMLGRVFGGEHEVSVTPVVILSAKAWQKYCGADANIVGRAIVFDETAYTVVGVMPATFDFPSSDTAFWLPYVARPSVAGTVSRITVTSRLKDGVSLDAATSEAKLLGYRLRASLQSPREQRRFQVVRLQDQMVAPVRPALRVLVVAVGIVLLIVCANVANLLLARGTARQREIRIRRAIGATRGRIMRQVFAESLVVAAIGGVAGMFIAYGGLELINRVTRVSSPAVLRGEPIPGGAAAILPRSDELSIDGTALGFVCAVTVAARILFGILPAISLSRIRATDVITMTMNPSRTTKAGYLLSTVQLALATTLLVGAGLLIHSFVRLSFVDIGYDPKNVLEFELNVPRQYPTARKAALAEDLAGRLRQLPEVQAAGFTNVPPLKVAALYSRPSLPAEMSDMPLGIEALPQARTVSADYLRAMGVRLLEGRWFDVRDREGQPLALLVNRAYARNYLHGRSPIGATLQGGPVSGDIVGVVDDVRQRLDEEPFPIVYKDPRQAIATLPDAMEPDVRDTLVVGSLSFAVRVAGEPLAIVPQVRAVVRQLDPAAAMQGVTTMDALVSASVVRPRLYALLMGVFGTIAAVLAAIGVYGVLAHAVTERTPEIGLRLALGAQRREVLSLIVGRGGVMAVIGITSGIVGAMVLTRYMAGLLFGITASDPFTYAAAAVLFTGIALLASYIPARRAMNVDPLIALRSD